MLEISRVMMKPKRIEIDGLLLVTTGPLRDGEQCPSIERRDGGGAMEKIGGGGGSWEQRWQAYIVTIDVLKWRERERNEIDQPSVSMQLLAIKSSFFSSSLSLLTTTTDTRTRMYHCDDRTQQNPSLTSEWTTSMYNHFALLRVNREKKEEEEEERARHA